MTTAVDSRVSDLLDDALRVVQGGDPSPENAALAHLIRCSRSAAEVLEQARDGSGRADDDRRTEIAAQARSALTCAVMLTRAVAR